MSRLHFELNRLYLSEDRPGSGAGAEARGPGEVEVEVDAAGATGAGVGAGAGTGEQIDAGVGAGVGAGIGAEVDAQAPTDPGPDPRADKGAATGPLCDATGRTRALVLALAHPPGWEALSRVWHGVQSELALPAPAIAISGSDALQLWFSLASPIAPAVGHVFLEGLRRRFLREVPARYVRLQVGRQAPRLPPAQQYSGNWSAFVAPDLAPVFGDAPWLDVEPGADGQATLLRGIRVTPRAAFEAALHLLETPGAAAGPGTSHAPQADAMPQADATLRADPRPQADATPRADPTLQANATPLANAMPAADGERPAHAEPPAEAKPAAVPPSVHEPAPDLPPAAAWAASALVPPRPSTDGDDLQPSRSATVDAVADLSPPSPLPAGSAEARQFLLSVMQDPGISMALRIEAAKALLHAARGPGC